MILPSGNPERHVFGRWRFNADVGDLYDGDIITRLEPRVAKLLVHFLANQHKVISRDELIATVWENRIVSDDAINRCVSIIRQILSPEDKNAYIETVVRKGYLAHFPPAPQSEPPGAQPPQSRKYLLLSVFAGVAAIILYIAIGKVGESTREVREPASAGPPMVAVLPFTSAGQESESEFFANGVHNDLLTQLTKLQSMRVISSTSVMEYRNTEHNLRKIGEELGADVILEGSVQIAANRIRINAQLIDTRTDQHLWAESYDRELSPLNIFDVQSEIAHAIAEELHATLTAQDSQALTLIPTENMAAYRAYHRAMQYRNAPGTNLNEPEYRQALEEAVDLDPTFSRAWAELVSTLAYLNIDGDHPDMTLRAEQALQRLQAVAPGSADLLIGQAAYVYYALKDYDRAHDIISQALTMNPSDVNAVQLRSWIERRQGDFDAFVDSRKEARRLDPRNPVLTANVLNGLLLTHRYDEAWAETERSPLESFQTGYTQNLLLFRKHRDFKRLQKSMRELCHLFQEPDCGWDTHIAIRDYLGALASLDQPKDGFERPVISENNQRRLLTYWLMNDDALLRQELVQWQGQLKKDSEDAGDFQPRQPLIELALLAGIQGNADESGQLIERWLRQQPIDWAERSVTRHVACRVLGMIAATQAAVKCIRDGLAEPSYVTPFLEPYLPFYDPVRNEPEFMEMLADIDAGGPLR